MQKDIYAAEMEGLVTDPAPFTHLDLPFTQDPDNARRIAFAEIFRTKPARKYVLPDWIKPPTDRTLPSHAGLLALIREAKDKGHIWADAALAELSIFTGIPYTFKRRASFNFERYEIEVAQ